MRRATLGGGGSVPSSRSTASRRRVPGEPVIQRRVLRDFLSDRGPADGCTSLAFYGSYAFFEKRWIKENKPKSRFRKETMAFHAPDLGTLGFAAYGCLASLGVSVRPCLQFTHIIWAAKAGPTKAPYIFSTVASGEPLGGQQIILIRVLVDCCDCAWATSSKPYGSGGGAASLREAEGPAALDAGVSLIGLELQGTAAPANNFMSDIHSTTEKAAICDACFSSPVLTAFCHRQTTCGTYELDALQTKP